MIIIGDVHGCYKTLTKLVNKLPERNICFTGDLIDRGPQSRDVINFVIHNKLHTVRGNHEELMIEDSDRSLWFVQGGEQTLDSYIGNEKEFDIHKKWMKNLPLYLKFIDIGLIISHSSAAKYILSNENKIFEIDIVWDRVKNPEEIPNHYNVFGHTPHLEPIIKKHFAIIDTGCVFDHYLTALQFPQMKIFQEKCID